jgi:hypothetical protein
MSFHQSNLRNDNRRLKKKSLGVSNPIPEYSIQLEDDFGSRQRLASQLAGRQLPVVSA